MAENSLNFSGVSMLPTLKAGDLLKMVSYEKRGIFVGDVVAFQTPIGSGLAAHRVAAVDHKGLKTKGDNNDKIDDWVLSPHNIVGRIVSAQRGGKKIIILGGFWGRQYVRAIRTIRYLYRTLKFVLLSPLYHWLAAKGMFRKQFSRRLSPRLYCFKRGKDAELQLIWGKRVIGRLTPGQKQWLIRRPFRLFVDEASLPVNHYSTLDFLRIPHFNPADPVSIRC